MELVRAICARRERGDYGSADWAEPEIEYVLADGPTPGTWRGLDEMGQSIRVSSAPGTIFAPSWRTVGSSTTTASLCFSRPKGVARRVQYSIANERLPTSAPPDF